MKILLLSDPASSHTIKWARSLVENGLEVYIFGLPNSDSSIYKNHPNIQLYTLGFDDSIVKANTGNISKLRYLKALPKVKEVIEKLEPDIVHAHFATSYGLIGALSGFHPYVLSVWGTDVFEFPNKSFLHEALIRYNFRRADKILSTSHVMAAEARRYTDKEVEVTPFGIDLSVFSPRQVESLFDEDDIVVGTVKTLEKKYGIEYLIRAFKILKDKYRDLPLKLLIVGGGLQEKYLKDLAEELEVNHDTIFAGRVSYGRVPNYQNMLSVFVSLSDSESFGVAVIEASACEKPVVVSNVGGLPEVVEDGVTGFVVPPRDPGKAAEAIEKLILDRGLRVKMGQAGRERVKRLYDWDDSVKRMINIYKGILKVREQLG